MFLQKLIHGFDVFEFLQKVLLVSRQNRISNFYGNPPAVPSRINPNIPFSIPTEVSTGIPFKIGPEVVSVIHLDVPAEFCVEFIL